MEPRRLILDKNIKENLNYLYFMFTKMGQYSGLPTNAMIYNLSILRSVILNFVIYKFYIIFKNINNIFFYTIQNIYYV